MSLSHDKIARLSRMSIDELHVERGRTVYADRLGKKAITGEHPLSYHVNTVTSGGQTRVLFNTRVPRPPGREKLARITKSLLSRYRKKLYRKIPRSHIYGEPSPPISIRRTCPHLTHRVVARVRKSTTTVRTGI